MVTVQWSVLFAVRFSSNSGLEKPIQTKFPFTNGNKVHRNGTADK